MPQLARGPQQPGYLGAYNWRATVIGAFLLFVSNVVPTQYLAEHFAYQPVLGTPIATFGTVGIYAPYRWALWLLRFGGTSDLAIKQPMLHGALMASVGILISLLTVALINMFHNKKLLLNTEDLHGSARWANRNDLTETGLLTATSGVYVGGWTDPKTNLLHYLKHDGPEHVIALAPTRSGKGVSLVIPTLLSWKDSVVVYDIKGENWAKTAGFRQASGQLCFKFAPVEPTAGTRFNPLAEIRIGTDREVSDAQNMAEMLCRTGKDGNGNEDHWITTAASLVTGLILHVCYEARLHKKRFATLTDLAAALTPMPEKNDPLQTDKEKEDAARAYFTSVRDYVHAEDESFKDPFGNSLHTQTHPVVQEKMQEILLKAPNEFTGVLSTAKKALTLYSDPLVARNIASSDFAIDDLVNFKNPISLYIVVPPSDKTRLKPLIRLLFTMIVNRLTEKMDFSETGEQKRNAHRLLLLIDEFPTLGNMAIFAEALAYMGGYGLKAYLIAQDIAQIYEHYTKNESIISNCHIRVAFAPNNPITAETLSKMTGTTTIKRAAMSFSGARSSTIMSQVSQNIEHISRPLMTVDEITRLPAAKKEGQGDAQKIVEPGAMLIFVAGSYTVFGTQILYFRDPELSRRAKFPLPKTSYSIDHQGVIDSVGILRVKPQPVAATTVVQAGALNIVQPVATSTITAAAQALPAPVATADALPTSGHLIVLDDENDFDIDTTTPAGVDEPETAIAAFAEPESDHQPIFDEPDYEAYDDGLSDDADDLDQEDKIDRTDGQEHTSEEAEVPLIAAPSSTEAYER